MYFKIVGIKNARSNERHLLELGMNTANIQQYSLSAKHFAKYL